MAAVVFCCTIMPAAHAAVSPVQFDAARKIWLLTTAHNSYAMGVDGNGTLQHLYWGGSLWRIEDVPAATPKRDVSSFDPRQMLEAEEYPGWGGPLYYEPALKLTR